MFKKFLFISTLLATILSFASEKNLSTEKFFNPVVKGKSPKVFWWPQKDISIKNGILKLHSSAKTCNSGFKLNLYETGTAIELSFSEKVKGGTGLFICTFFSFQRALGNKSIKLNSQEWTSKTLEATLPTGTTQIRITFCAKGKNTTVFTKDMSVKIISNSQTKANSKIKVKNGNNYVNCTGVYLVKSKPFFEFYDKKAAIILVKYLEKVTGELLPIKYISDPQKNIKPGMILLGQAVNQSGFIKSETLNALKQGGYVLNIKEGVVALAGKSPSGVICGIYTLLEKVLNITFVTEYTSEPELNKRNEIVFKPMTFSKSPAFELRLIRSEGSLKYTDWNYLGDARIIGCRTSSTCHTAPGLVNFDKYHKEHPEYFALGKDEKRLHRDPQKKTFEIHFCMSNPEVQQLIGKQMISWMNANPTAKYFWLTPGDGGGQYCRCAKCLAMDEKPGVISDRNLKFINSIAKIVKKKFPAKIIMTLAYVDLEEPPVKTKPMSNVRILYCPYPRNWSNHLEAFDKKYNVEGMRTLNGWLKICAKNMYVFCYPSCCGERLNIYPSFYANYEKFMYYAKHGVKGLIFCGLYPNQNGYLGHNSFNAMSRYVLGKALWNPKIEIEKEIDSFMKLYYGPAAPFMRNFFNLIHREVKDRNFVQHTEEVKRGFVTKKLADKSYAIFAKAEKAVAANPRYLKRILTEKVYLFFADLSDRCRTNGKISEQEMPAYAKRLAEFAKLCKKFGLLNFARGKSPQDWFWETALLKIKTRNLKRSKKIDELIANPLNTLGQSVPRCQEKLKNGWQIPMEGVAGGIALQNYSYHCPLKKNSKLLRRPSSGYGYVMTCLYLKSAPQKPTSLKLEGLCSEHKGKTMMSILVNGKSIFKGEAPFAKNQWAWKTFKIPAGFLKKGKNVIKFKNITPDIVTADEKKHVAFIVGRKKNYYWGWYIVSGIKIIQP